MFYWHTETGNQCVDRYPQLEGMLPPVQAGKLPFVMLASGIAEAGMMKRLPARRYRAGFD